MIYKKITNKLPTLAGILLTGMIAGCEGCKKEAKTGATAQDGLISECRNLLEGQRKDIFEHELAPSVRKEKVASLEDVAQAIRDFPLMVRKDSLGAQFAYSSTDDVEFAQYILTQSLGDLKKKDIKVGGIFQGMASDVRTQLLSFISSNKGANHRGSIGIGAVLHIVQCYNKTAQALSELEAGVRDVNSVAEILKKVNDDLTDEYKITRLQKMENIVNKEALEEIMNDVFQKDDYDVPRGEGHEKGNISHLLGKMDCVCTIPEFTKIINESGFFGLLGNSKASKRLKMTPSFLQSLTNTEDLCNTIRDHKGQKAYEDTEGLRELLTNNTQLEKMKAILANESSEHHKFFKDFVGVVATHVKAKITEYLDKHPKGKVVSLEEAFSLNEKRSNFNFGAIQKFFAKSLKLIDKYRVGMAVTEQEVRDFANNEKASDAFKRSFKKWSDIGISLASTSFESTESASKEDKEDKEDKEEE